MSKYRCIFCRGKIEEDADDMIYSYNPTEKQIKDSGEDITDSDYHWVICDECGEDLEYAEKQGYTSNDLADYYCNRCGQRVYKEKLIKCRKNLQNDSISLCNGTGTYKGKPCPDCNGTGQYYPYYCIRCDENMFTFEVEAL
jgi:hypothetical protein